MTSTFAITSAARNMHYNDTKSVGSRSFSEFKTQTENKLANFGKGDVGDIKTVNVRDLFAGGTAKSSNPTIKEEVRFNEEKLESDAWYAFGIEHGVWVNGIDAEKFISEIAPGNNKDKRSRNVVNFLEAVADMLQTFQDEMVRMAAAGTPPAQMKAFAAQVMSGGGPSDLESMQKLPDAGSEGAKFGFANLMHILRTESPANIERTLLNNIKEVDGNRADTGLGLVKSMQAGFHERIAETKKSLDIKPVDPDSRRRELTNERARFLMSSRSAIGKLPVDKQDAAWAELNLLLDAAVDKALTTDGVPTTPLFEGPTDSVVPYSESAFHAVSQENDRNFREDVAAGAAIGTVVGGPVGGLVGGLVGGMKNKFFG